MAAWSLPELAGGGRTGGAAVDPPPRGRSSSAPRPRVRAVESPSLPQRAAHRAPRRRERLADVRGAPHAACRLRRGLRRSRRGARQVGRARVRLSRAGPRAPGEDGFSRSDPDPPRPGAAQGSNAHQRDSLRSFSRYVCVRGPSVAVHWHKVPARRTGSGPRSEHVNMLLLPWPLRVRESDFVPVEGSVRPSTEPSGFFRFAPAEALDLDLVVATIRAAGGKPPRFHAAVCTSSSWATRSPSSLSSARTSPRSTTSSTSSAPSDRRSSSPLFSTAPSSQRAGPPGTRTCSPTTRDPPC